MTKVEHLALLIHITIYISCLERLLTGKQTLHLLSKDITFACDVERTIMTCTDGIQFAKGCISICLIESTVMVGIHHIALWHIYEETNLEGMGVQFVWIFLAYL